MIALTLMAAYLVAEFVCRIADRTGVRWQAVVKWEGGYYTHKARSRQDALEWLACYPNTAYCVVERALHGTIDIVGGRHAQMSTRTA